MMKFVFECIRCGDSVEIPVVVDDFTNNTTINSLLLNIGAFDFTADMSQLCVTCKTMLDEIMKSYLECRHDARERFMRGEKVDLCQKS